MSTNVPKLTPEQAAIISAYTGYLIGNFAEMHEYVEKVMGRPVWTHEMGSQVIADQIREASRADFLALNPAAAAVTR